MIDQLINFIRNISRSLPYNISLSGLFFSLVTAHPLGLYFTLSQLIFALGINFVLKYLLMLINPQNPQWLRPSPPIDGCGTFPTHNNNFSNFGGMPSGHSQTIMFSAMFWILYIWRKGKTSLIWSFVSTLIILLISAVVMFSRINEGCHTGLQVTIGGILGSFFGTLIYFLLETNQPQIFN